MKGLITIIFAFITLNLSAQDLTYEQAQDITFTRTIKNGTKFNSYKCENGTLINIGDTLTLGEPHSGKEQTDAVWGTNKVYDFILYGNLMMQMGGMVYLPTSHKSEDIIVEKLYVTHIKFSKKSPIYVSAYAKNKEAIGGTQGRTITDIDKALNSGEILSGNSPMTREQAIAKLKETKDLMDLGLIGEDEYNKLKNELTTIIMNKK